MALFNLERVSLTCLTGRKICRPTCNIQQVYSLRLSSNLVPTQTLSLQSLDILDTYRGLVKLGKIEFDNDQVRVLMQLRRLHRDLDNYAPPALTSHYLSRDNRIDRAHPWWVRTRERDDESVESDEKGLVRVKTHTEDLAELTTPKGVLVTGPPGSGKSFLVDLWYNALPTPHKARKHYNELVLEIYRGVWEETQYRMKQSSKGDARNAVAQPWTRAIRDQWRELVATGSLPAKWIRRPDTFFRVQGYSTQPTIAFVVARRLLLRHWLLVFDEIQLLDVSSATLLADVLSWYWRMGGVIVGTSNKVPDDLYKHGVQRDRLEPFVEALKARCPVVDLHTEHDWREVRARRSVRARRTWYTYEEQDLFTVKMEELIGHLAKPTPQKLQIFGRTLHVHLCVDGICQLTFQQLCKESLGPADYLTLASTFHTVVITSIPVLRLSNKDQARRFISLIDALYEARCRLICLAESKLEHLFFPDACDDMQSKHAAGDIDMLLAEAVGASRNIYRPNVSSYDAPDMVETHPPPEARPGGAAALETLTIFSGKDEQFAFRRALSRLLEMTSESYGREQRWTPLPDAARKWEKPGSFGSTQAKVSVLHVTQETCAPIDGDFAKEASHDNAGRVLQRPEPPRLREEHVWGVRDDSGNNTGKPRSIRRRHISGSTGSK